MECVAGALEGKPTEPAVVALDGKGWGVACAVAGAETEAMIGVEFSSREAALAAVPDLALVLAIPEQLELRRQLATARSDTGRLATVLDLLVLLSRERRFFSAAMMLCNECCVRLRLDRVSLGWMEHGRARLRAVSHTEKIEAKMEVVQRIEAAMEECADQGEEVLFPRPEGQLTVVREHAAYAKLQQVSAVASLPLFPVKPPAAAPKDPAEEPVLAVLTVERGVGELTADELRTLRVLADQAAVLLERLRGEDRWWGAKFGAWMREKAARLVGVEHTGWKLLGLLLMVALAVLIFGRKEYRVEGTFQVRTDAMTQLTAPFDGHLDQAPVRAGDAVVEGQPLFALDARELRLQRQAAVAERERQTAEVIHTEAAGDIAGMRIARAKLEQAGAQIELLDYQLARAEVKAPFAGVVVEGDLKERLAAPVQKGELLMRVARVEGMYLVMDIGEAEVGEVAAGAHGEAAFASLPGRRFPFVIETIQPVARTRQGGNVFEARCRFEVEPQLWWRPGMSGIGKISAGKRSLLWIVSHKTVDYLRLRFW